MFKSLAQTLSFILGHPLNSHRKIAALFTFVKWQVRSVLFRSPSLISWVNQTKLLVRKGETGLTGNLYCGFMEFEDMCFVLHFLRKSDAFFDIGANVGAYTVLASGVVECQSTCFEPIPDTFQGLLEQLQLNQITDRVAAHNKGLADRSGKLEFTNTLNCMNRVNTDPSNKNVTEVEVTTLDDEFIPSACTLVKIDVEGYEAFVLEGGKRFFADRHVAAIVIELDGYGKQFGISDADTHATIKAHGFSPVVYSPLTRKLERVDSIRSGGNTIYVRDVEFAQRRCMEAEKVVVHTVGGLCI